MISAPIGLIVFSLAHGTLSWSETQHLANAGRDEWIQHLTNIQGRWLAAQLAPSDRAGVDGALEALFFAPSAIDWLDRGAGIALEVGALAAALWT